MVSIQLNVILFDKLRDQFPVSSLCKLIIKTNINFVDKYNNNFSHLRLESTVLITLFIFLKYYPKNLLLPIMETKNDHKNEPTDKQKQSDELSNTEFKPKTNEELNEAKPARLKRRQATEEELNNPLHGVKLVQVLERLVEFYGWEYLAERVNIRCFRYNPTMKSSLGFLRKTRWAREHVEDVYLEMLEEE